MAKEKKQNDLYLIPKSKVVFELNIYDKATGKNEKAFINGSTRGVAALIRSIMKSNFKSTGLKDVKLKELDSGAKVVENFTFGNKGDVKNFNVEVNKVKFKWNTVNKETGEKSQDYPELFLYRNRREENNTVTFGKNPENEKAIMKKLENLIKALENKDAKEVEVSIKVFKGKDGKEKNFVEYIGEAKNPEKAEKKIDKESPKTETPKQEKKPKPADVDEIPF